MSSPLPFRAIADTMPLSVVVCDMAGHYLYMNEAGRRLARVQNTDIVGKRWQDLFPEAAETPFGAAFARVAAGGARETIEYHFVPLDRWVRQELFRVDDSIIVFAEDVSASRRGTTAEAGLRALFDAMPQIGWTARPDGYVDFFNRGFYEYTGVTYDEAKGWSWSIVHDPAELPGLIEQWRECLRTGVPLHREFPLRRHDGVFRWFLGRAVPVRDRDRRIVQWVGICTDIHDRREAEQQTQQCGKMPSGRPASARPSSASSGTTCGAR